MGAKPKAGGAKKRSAKAALPTTKEKEKPQRERFIEAARERGVTTESFERLFAKVVPPKASRPNRG
jgi:hypothetical protein